MANWIMEGWSLALALPAWRWDERPRATRAKVTSKAALVQADPVCVGCGAALVGHHELCTDCFLQVW